MHKHRCLEAGAPLVMVESEGVTEDVEGGSGGASGGRGWRTDVPAAFVRGLGLERVMFEAADPKVRWVVRWVVRWMVRWMVRWVQKSREMCVNLGVRF